MGEDHSGTPSPFASIAPRLQLGAVREVAAAEGGRRYPMAVAGA